MHILVTGGTGFIGTANGCHGSTWKTRSGGARDAAPVVRLLIGEMAHLLLTGQQAIPKRTLESGYRFRYPELRPALDSVLGGR
jgi:NAD dependent epimerase/dehydratase family enzyme